MNAGNVEFTFEGKELWIIWMGKDHHKLSAYQTAKLAKFINRRLAKQKSKL